MKKLLLTVFTLCLAGTANAGIPLFNATCPGKIEVHADEGGPVYLNGKAAKIKKVTTITMKPKGQVSRSLSA